MAETLAPTMSVLYLLVDIRVLFGYVKAVETLVDDLIGVTALFSGGKILPQSFIWKGKVYSIIRVEFSYERREGITRQIYFAVTAGAATYELVFNTITFVWRIARVYLPGD